MQLESAPSPTPSFWRYPINVGGFAKDDLSRFVEDDLYEILRPTVVASHAPQSTFQNASNPSLAYGDLRSVMDDRVSNLTQFLRQVGLALHGHGDQNVQKHPIKLKALSGDSHNGGKRPVVIDDGRQRCVLKFADPRPHVLLFDFLRELSDDLGIDLTSPQIHADRGHQWYCMPFLETCENLDPSNANAEGFMFAIGAVTALAYCLRMVDLHLENIMVFQGKPIIVDPECILYNFAADDQHDRLLSTGLLSHNPGLSALRGGDVSKLKINQIGLSERPDGMLDYHKPAPQFHNRLHLDNGEIADPAQYKAHVTSGFAAAYKWFLDNPDLSTDILSHRVGDDFRIRYLVRKTRLYITTIHMLNLPVDMDGASWQKSVLERFRAAGHFPTRVSDRLVNVEISDMVARDVPYFWVNAGERRIRHRTGIMQRLSCTRTPYDQALADLRSLSKEDMKEQLGVLERFLDAKLEA